MKRLSVVLMIMLFLLTSYALMADEKGVVKKVYDADYIKVKIDGKNYKVKLVGVDVPEKKWGTAKNIKTAIKDAEKYVKELIDNKEVKLVADKKAGDKNKKGRLLRYVYIGRKNVNQELIKKGYADVADYDFSKKKTWAKYKKTAENKKLGIWSEEVKKEGLLSRWFGRDKDKEDDADDEDDDDVQEVATRSRLSNGDKGGDTSWYKRSLSRKTFYVTPHGKKIHKKDCPHLKDSKKVMKITGSEAKEKGYEPCKTCKPLED